MKISDYNYNLPDHLIADSPPMIRGDSRLLVLDRKNGRIFDRNYANVTDYLGEGDVLVLNRTKVIKARIEAIKSNGAKRELIVLEKHGSADDWFRHKVLYRKKLTKGDKLKVHEATLVVEDIIGEGIAVVKSDVDLRVVLDRYGTVPLPPYMRRSATEDDIKRYQTVWANDMGSVAAPTASLNMTQEIIDQLEKNGVSVCYLTLHVGLGTFLPIRTDDIEDHKMHKEYFEIPIQTVEQIKLAKSRGNKVVAVGTTVARTLEFAADDINTTTDDLSGEADIFIYPGYRFHVVDSLLTNFHAPKSTVLMLAAAFAEWDNLQKAYTHAISENYRFLSYGDSMLIL